MPRAWFCTCSSTAACNPGVFQVDLYSEIVLDYFRNPRNKGPLPGADAASRDSNPLCGDELSVFLKLDASGRVAQARFDGSGCAISQACASMLCEAVEGKSLDEVRALDKDFVFKLLGGPVSVARVKCALLSLKVLKLAVYSFLGKRLETQAEEFG